MRPACRCSVGGGRDGYIEYSLDALMRLFVVEDVSAWSAPSAPSPQVTAARRIRCTAANRVSLTFRAARRESEGAANNVTPA